MWYLGMRMYEWFVEFIYEYSMCIGNVFVFDYEFYVYYCLFVFNLQILLDIIMYLDMSKYKFLNKRVSFYYYDNGIRRDYYYVIQFQVIFWKNIKSIKFGKVFLIFKWKDCGVWIDIKFIEQFF